MFDEEIIKAEMLDGIITRETGTVDWDAVFGTYEVIDGLYYFRINDDAHVFNNNTFVDSMPGFYARLGGADSGGQ